MPAYILPPLPFSWYPTGKNTAWGHGGHSASPRHFAQDYKGALICTYVVLYIGRRLVPAFVFQKNFCLHHNNPSILLHNKLLYTGCTSLSLCWWISYKSNGNTWSFAIKMQRWCLWYDCRDAGSICNLIALVEKFVTLVLEKLCIQRWMNTDRN